jgi:predicted TIM-barrel enzyme
MGFETKFNTLFGSKPIIGMIHLAGNSRKERIQRALEELAIYEKEGVNGAIIEDYHGPAEDIWKTLEKAQKYDYKIILGINNLRNPYSNFYAIKLGVKFVQFDSVQSDNIDVPCYEKLRNENPELIFLGGVRFKYMSPSKNSLEKDLQDGILRCDAIVTTGEGTGIETPIEKLRIFKNYLKEFPLIVGAGLNITNVYEQMKIVDGAIVGSSFKPNKDTSLPVDRYLVKDLMNIVKEIRKI